MFYNRFNTRNGVVQKKNICIFLRNSTKFMGCICTPLSPTNYVIEINKIAYFYRATYVKSMRYKLDK